MYKSVNTQFKIIKLSLLACGVFFAANASAQQRIILNTSPTPTEIELESGSDVAIDPLTGNLFAVPADPAACSGTLSCDDVEVDIISFNAAPTTVGQGQSVSFNWSSRGAWSCDGSGFSTTTWNSTGKQPSGSQNVSTAGVPLGSYNVVLDCSNGPVTDQLIRSVTVEEDSGIGNCGPEGRLPPAGMTRDSAIILGSTQQTLNHTQVFGQPFPVGTDINMEIDQNKYAAIEFNTGSTPTGSVDSFSFNALFSPTIRSGRKLVTISECPGDFTTQVDPGCRKEIFIGSINWQMGGTLGCNLSSNTTYYINILYTEDNQAPFDWDCTAHPNGNGRCGNTFNP